MSIHNINFKITREESILIGQIVQRAAALSKPQTFDGMSANMDITACHANGCRLKLKELLDAPEFDFLHDFWGIARHIDRTTGQLRDCFVPRFAEPVAA